MTVEIKEADNCGRTPQRIFSKVEQPAASSASRIPVSRSSIAVMYIFEIMPMEQMDCVTTPQKAPGLVTRIHIKAQTSAGMVRIRRIRTRKTTVTGLGTILVEARKDTGMARMPPNSVPKMAMATV